MDSPCFSEIQPAYARLHWQMSSCEKLCLQQILETCSPDLAIEVGTYQGGSLQILAQFAKQVISIDIDPTVHERLSGLFQNVDFRTGSSYQLLPSILETCKQSNSHVGFILIDGDHSSEGVRRDIEAVLSVRPSTRCILLMHDAFNPDCRSGILSASWESCPWVKSVEVDFVPGIYHQYAYDTAAAKTMWGGFACAVLTPSPRTDLLTISTLQKGLFDAVYAASSHHPKHEASTNPFIRRIIAKLKRSTISKLN